MSLDDIPTTELARELARRKRAEIDAFIKYAPRMTDESLQAVVDNEDCDFFRINEYEPPADHCRGCAAQHELDQRERRAQLKQQEQPGERPSWCNSCISGSAADLEKDNVLARQLYPGADSHDYVQVTAVARSNDGGKLVVATFQRTNDPDSSYFNITYPRETHIRSIWRRV